MNKKIQPITSLRNTAKLEKDLSENNGCLFITKNGYSDLVILSPEKYGGLQARLSEKNEEMPTNVRTAPQNVELNGAAQCDPLGFVRCRSQSIAIGVAAVHANAERILAAVKEAAADKVSVLALPELCLTGYTCEDLFSSDTLLSEVENEIIRIVAESSSFDVFFAFGAPLRNGNSIYNCAIAACHGKLLGAVPKTYLPEYGEFYEKRHFAKAGADGQIELGGRSYPFGTHLLFVDENYLKLRIAIEICEDAWVPLTPSTAASLAGADVILNLSASNEVVGKKEFRSDLVKMTSARLCAAYVYADAGDEESTTDLVFGSHNLIAENGRLLAETKLFAMEKATSEIDVEKLLAERRKTTTFGEKNDSPFQKIYFSLLLTAPAELLRHYPRLPFIPERKEIDLDRVATILDIQAKGLATRLRAIGLSKVLVGLSGGLDSTLALLVAAEAFAGLGYDRKGIEAVTMPAFGTSERTRRNAEKLAACLGVSFREINITETLKSHFRDIKHDIADENTTFENAQARERTQVLMDLANDESALMIGTGDLSELCLGWTTFNGDHMSMYGVNASIPKTLVRYLCEGYALLHPETAAALKDIIETPISPELLPTDSQGGIAQKTEEKIGPYELHDFFIYHFLRFGFRPRKIYYLACQSFAGKYDGAAIKKWLRVFFLRFFQNQFKRNCLPDGAKVGTVAISPRGDWRMPSDADPSDFISEIDEL
jgi:NAD+ synthase (glutamine-hydrolysing)